MDTLTAVVPTPSTTEPGKSTYKVFICDSNTPLADKITKDMSKEHVKYLNSLDRALKSNYSGKRKDYAGRIEKIKQANSIASSNLYDVGGLTIQYDECD